jgi:hypothetical protein
MSAISLGTPEGTQAASAVSQYLREHPLQNWSDILAGTGADERLLTDAYKAGWFRAVHLGYVSDDWIQGKMCEWLAVNPAWRFSRDQIGEDRAAQREAALAAAMEFEALRDRLGIPFPCFPG